MCPTHMGYDCKLFFTTFHLEMKRIYECEKSENFNILEKSKSPLQPISFGVEKFSR